MSEFKIACPNCQQHLLCGESYRGVQFPCPTCGATIVVPPLADPPPPAGLRIAAAAPAPMAPREPQPHIPRRPYVSSRTRGKSWLTPKQKWITLGSLGGLSCLFFLVGWLVIPEEGLTVKFGSNNADSSNGFASPEAVFEAMKNASTDAEHLSFLLPQERYDMAYISVLMARAMVEAQSDESKKREAEKAFTALVEKYQLADKLEFNVSSGLEQDEPMAAKAFADVDLTALTDDFDRFTKKYSTEHFSVIDDDVKPVSMKDLKIEGDAATALIVSSDGTEEPALFVRSGGGWFLSMGEEEHSEPQTKMLLHITFESEASLGTATAQALLKAVDYDRSSPATLDKLTSSHYEATLSFKVPKLSDSKAIMKAIEQAPGVNKVENMGEQLAMMFATKLEEYVNSSRADSRSLEDNPGREPAGGPEQTFQASGSLERMQQIEDCAHQLLQIGEAFNRWASKHGQQFPFNVSAANGGTREYCNRAADGFDANAFRHFEVMSSYSSLGLAPITPAVLVCPADNSKKPAIKWESLTASNVTYLLRTGTQLKPGDYREVLARCPIHGNSLACAEVVDTGK